MDELSEEQKLTVSRARKASAVPRPVLPRGRAVHGPSTGVYVKLEDTVRSFGEILDGKCDEICPSSSSA